MVKDLESLLKSDNDSEKEIVKAIPSLSERSRIFLAASEIKKICDESDHSQFFPYGGEGYKGSVRHYLESSTEIAFAAVQPGNANDLSKIIKVLGMTKAPFAIKGGGHTSNPEFSSTKGIQISMARFNKIQFCPEFINPPRLEVGAGCLWDEVYRSLDGTGLNIVGGSAIAGVGVAGWLLGGGYSLKTNQYGLGIDNLLGIEIVLPNGTVVSATQGSKLLAAVKGGGNNFGIVTKFTLQTHTQSDEVFGGLLEYEAEEAEEVKDAIVDFVNNSKDPKAAIVAAFRYYNRPGGLQFNLTVQYFYDGPKPSRNPFQKFVDIPHNLVLANGAGAGKEQRGPTSSLTYFEFDHAFSEMMDDSIIDQHNDKQPGFNVEVFKSEIVPYLEETDNIGSEAFLSGYEHKHLNALNIEDFKQGQVVSPQATDVVNESRNIWENHPPPSHGFEAKVLSNATKSTSFPVRAMAGVGENPRGRWANVMVSKYTRDIINEVERQAKKAAKHLVKHSGKSVIVDVWPFVPDMFKNSDRSAAWPHNPDEPNGPLLVLFQWEGKENDKFWIDQMRRALTALESKVYGIGQKRNLPVYANTALVEHVTVEDVYRGNLQGLIEFRAKVDPTDIMGQAGGFRIPLRGN